jgi:hypothetical protein
MTKAKTLAKMHEETINLHKDPNKSSMTKVKDYETQNQ